MAADPFEQVADAPLFVVPRMLDALRGYRAGPKLADLPGPSPSPERERLASQLDHLTGTLIEGIEAHPTKFWVLQQFQQALIAVQQEDAEAREHFVTELERLLQIVGIGSSDGVVEYYLSRP
ncbi:DUF4844 domain-containing protein [Massilia sp. 9096]|uniref:DUF4844 domain-containing protein n=1 Tax=Massilia sp. 9096 TaxID=1500894 RepID=UPI0005650B6B|nr:DUF4844 domain-containing protein [Massilia sp. 9096]